ncbi:MAG: Gfo/Idh/MocA family oxidoreductase [Novosphingobium sp.]
MTKEAIRALVVGTGFGCRVHVPALRAAGFDIVGLVGRDAERLARKAETLGLPASHTDLDAAISATGAQLVTIATTPSTHAGLARQAIARGCHVLCEKPFAFDVGEGASLLELAERSGIVHMVAHEFRWLPERALFGRAIAEGMIGEPRFLAVDQFIPFCASRDARLPKWWFDKDSGGGWLGASGSHMIDQIRAWLGDFHSLSANLMVVSDRQDVADDSFSMRFRLASGVEGSMQQSASAWGPSVSITRCMGSHGTVWIDAGKVFVADKAGTHELPMPDDLALPPQAADPASSDRLPHFELGPFTRLAQMLRAAIIGGTPPSNIAAATFADGLATMKIMDAMRQSARDGGALQVL